MRNLAFYRLPFRRNFMSLRRDSLLLPYTFLQSYKMQSLLQTLPPSSPLKKFMLKDFTQDQLLRQKHMFKQIIQKQTIQTTRITQLIKSKDFNINKTLDELIDHNIIDFDIWSDIMKVAFVERLNEIENQGEFSEVVTIFRRYIEKFVNRSLLHRFKFNLHDGILKDIDFSAMVGNMFRKKGKVESFKNEKNIFVFLKELNMKQSINMAEARKYYTRQIPRVKELIEQEEDISIIPGINSIYSALGIETPEMTKMFENRMEKIYEKRRQETNDFNLYDVLQITNTWAVTGRSNPALKFNNAEQMTDIILANNKTIQFFHSLLTVNLQTQHLIDRILSSTDLQQTNINLKVTLHKCLHILAIRGYDLSKHKKLTDRISSVCQSNYHVIIQILERKKIPLKSNCICRSDSYNLGQSQSIGDKNIQNAIKTIMTFAPPEISTGKLTFIKSLRFCRYSIDAMFVHGNEMYAIDFKQTGEFLIRPVGENNLKLEMLRYYGFKVARVDPLEEGFVQALKSKDIEEVFQYVKGRVEEKQEGEKVRK